MIVNPLLEELPARLDHTILRPDAVKMDVMRVCEEAKQHGFTVIFVPPCYLEEAVAAVAGTGVKVGVPIGFPLGGQTTGSKVAEAVEAVAHGALVLDMSLQRGVWVGGIGWALTITGTSIIAATLNLVGSAPEQNDIPPLMPWLANLPLAYKLVVIGAAMTVEEGFFRAFLQTRIGWIPSSLLFALSHASYGLPLLMLSVFIISLLIGWTFRRTGRLLPCIVAHGVFDAIQLLVVIPMAMKMIE